ncbi:MAG: BspA family leucine-rich repeat surface protein [Lachnospiraceae bacterium]|nr:BspA family leucine-rich repeat surface protein [Lachnospiraceae bacterium]
MLKRIMRISTVVMMALVLTLAASYVRGQSSAKAAERVVIDNSMLIQAMGQCTQAGNAITAIDVKTSKVAGGTEYSLNADGSVVGVFKNGTFSLCPAVSGNTVALEGDCANLFSTGNYGYLYTVRTIDLRGLDTSAVTSFRWTFGGSANFSLLESVNMSGCDFSSLSIASSMFSDNTKLTSVDLTGTDWSNVTTIEAIFLRDSLLTTNPLQGLSMPSLTNATQAFGSSGLINFSFNGWDIPHVTTTEKMFMDCTSLRTVNLTGLNSTVLANFSGMFSGCTELTTVTHGNFTPANGATFDSMFYLCAKLKSFDFTGIDTRNVTSFKSMFSGCTGLEHVYFGNNNTTKVTLMGGMFYDCRVLSDLDLSCFNTSAVTNMDDMFYNCDGLTTLNLRNFTCGKLAYCRRMFEDCDNLTYVDLSGFVARDSGKIRTDNMFNWCHRLQAINFEYLDPSTINTSKSEKMFGSFVSSYDDPNYLQSNYSLRAICMQSNAAMSGLFESIYGVSPSEYDITNHRVANGKCIYCGQCANIILGGWHDYVNGTCSQCGICEGVAENGRHNLVNGVCTYCGYSEGGISMGCTVTLGSNIALNLLFSVPNSVMSDTSTYVQLTFPDNTTKNIMLTTSVPETINGVTYRKIVYTMAAKEMADAITVKMFSGSNECIFEPTNQVSVKKYGEDILGSSSYSTAAKNLAKAMLNYGAYAQLYFGYNTRNLANANCALTLPDCTTVEEELRGSEVIVDSGTTTGVNYVGCSLLLEDEIIIRYWFTFDSNLSANIRQTYIANMQLTQASNGKYYHDSAPVAVKNWGNRYESAGNIYVIGYGPMTFVHDAVIFRANDSLGDLSRAMFLYWKAALVYVNTN